MKILYILLGYLINHVNSKCDELITQPQITCYQFTSECYILEGDEEDYQELQHINTQIVQKSFQIPFKEEPILIRVINSLNQNKIQEKLLCSLFVNIDYYITCMGFDLILYEEQTNYSELIRIDTKILANEHCDELFTNQDGSLSLFCLGSSSLKQYYLDFQRSVTLSLEYDVSDQIEDGCKKKQIRRNEEQYLIVFYQCLRWKIMQIKNNQSHTLFDASMKSQNIQLSNLSLIDDVTYCERNQQTYSIILIQDNFYVLIHLNYYETKNLNYFLIQQTKKIQKIIFQQKCSMIILVNELDKTNSSLIQTQKQLEIILDQKYSMDNIHFHSNLLFLQNQFELNILINARINQTYQICNTSLYFFDSNNLFSQFDQTKKVLQFYQYKPLSAFIKPRQKFVYVIERNNLFKSDDIVQCFRILEDNNNQKEKLQFTELMEFQNNCQTKYQRLLITQNFKYFNNANATFDLKNSDGSISVSISKYQYSQQNCLIRLYKSYFQHKVQLKQIINDYVCFQYESYFYIYDCKQLKLSNSVNLDQYYVLESQLVYYFVSRNNKNNNVLRGVKFQLESLLYFNIQLNNVITNVKQVSQNAFIYTKDSDLPLIMSTNPEKKPFYKYLSKNLYQPGPILFYFENENSKFIQYAKMLAISNKEHLKCYQIQEQLIISIQKLQPCYLIFAIQNSTQSLILNYFWDDELHQIKNYTFKDFQFYYPFKYSINTDSLAILLEQNNSLSIAIFQYNLSVLQFIEIIATDDSFFQFDQFRILFSFEKVWMYSFVKIFLVNLEIENLYQNTLKSNFSMNLKEEEGSIELKISIQNQCYELYSLMKSSLIEIQNNKRLKLNFSEMFYGPISNLTLINNSNVILKGPIIYKEELLNCAEQTSTLCYRQYHFQSLKPKQSFRVIVLENYFINVIKDYLWNQFYMTWIEQQYYLCISQLFDDLNIELIQCTENQYEFCKLISNISHNFNINLTNIADTIRVGNLIKLKPKDDNNNAIIFIDGINFNFYIVTGIILDILYIEKSNDQYLFLQKDINIWFDLQLAVNFNEYDFTIKLVSCKQSENVINIKLFIVKQLFSELFQLNINQKNDKIELLLQKQFRNQIPYNNSQNQDMIIQYIDDTHIILKQTQNALSHFYDVQEDRQFYDYFHKTMFNREIIRLNTTHLIFADQQFQQLQIGTIGYELEIQNSDEIEQHCQLFAQNEISNAIVTLQIHIIKNNKMFTNRILYIQITCFLFILIYTRQIKYKSKNQKQQQYA
ncbi:unnamed protein product [Paramecium octaurelia]|uniref:Transmembrane protein n=1 Tax=Paramecium octaurelia TaxID=43137 RepID=A0A8S1YKC5_PAROT|nr:unnamed protein product [Paramecium octaurelia]